MKQFGMKITTLSPVMLSAGPPAHNLLETLDFIPGNTVRGLLAERYLDTRAGSSPSDDKNFKELFLSDGTRFGFATLDGALPLPASARTCKYHGGFTAEKGHGVVDWIGSQPEDESICCKCGGPLDYFEGYWRPMDGTKSVFKKRIILRTSIDANRNSASLGRLYSNQVLGEGQSFFCEIEVDNDEAAAIMAGLIAEPFTAAIGTGRSRGQGWVEVRRAEHPCTGLNWGQARERFNQFKARGVNYLVVTLLSDAIFSDDYLRDLSAPSALHLELLGIDPQQWETEPHSGFSSLRTVFGFDGNPLFLPRIPRVAVEAGSVFLFRPKNDSASVKVPSGNGIGWIGENNREGYGRTVLWHPFHLSPEGWKWT